MNTERIKGGTSMIELFQLEQLVAYADCGTLSKAAEHLHMSQPTLTRNMQKLETEFGVSLFQHSKNKMVLNENGELAVSYARKLLENSKDMLHRVREFDRARHTITIGSCAPMPMLTLVQKATHLCPDTTVTSELKDNETLLKGLREEIYQVIILPFKPDGTDLYIKECGTESLFFALPKSHHFARRKGLYMKEMDGENMLLYSDIGFWHNIHKEKMPHSRFLIQNERFAFDELVQASILPSFVSDLTIRMNGQPENRVIIPILDAEASVTYYAVCLKINQSKLNLMF